MDKRQLYILLFCSFVPWTVGNGVLPLLPVYAVRLGASSSAVGAYLAFTYMAVAFGTLAAGWVSDRLQMRKNPLIVSGIAAVLVTWLMGRVTNLWELTALSAVLWFLGGMGITLTRILAGLFAGVGERGKVFGILTLSAPAGLLVGGLASGPITDRWGFPTMFGVFALFSIFWPVAALMLKDKPAVRAERAMRSATEGTPGLGWGIFLLSLSYLLAMMANFVSSMGRSLAMKELGFGAAPISITSAIGGAVSLPLTLVAGTLSDRVGRRALLASGYLGAAVGLGLLGYSVSLWHFSLAISLMYVQASASLAVGSALVADLVPKGALGRAMALFTATNWFGGVIGFAATGFAIQEMGFRVTFLLAALLPVASILLLVPIHVARPQMKDYPLGTHT